MTTEQIAERIRDKVAFRKVGDDEESSTYRASLELLEDVSVEHLIGVGRREAEALAREGSIHRIAENLRKTLFGVD